MGAEAPVPAGVGSEEVKAVGRPVAIVVLVILWLACAGLLIGLGGTGWTTRALLLVGLIAGVITFLAPR